MNLKIYIATHKKFNVPKSKYHIPLHVGREGKEDLGYLGDNTGDNISLKNPNYCELTGLYWIWKNVKDEDYVGLCHYRRYFLKPSFLMEIINHYKLLEKKIKMFLKPDLYEIHRHFTIKNNLLDKKIEKMENRLEKDLLKYNFVVLEKYWFSLPIKIHYKIGHINEDLAILQEVITEKYPDYLKSYEKIMNGYKLTVCNMFITNKKNYNDYMVWLFDILNEVEKRIKISKYPHQARVFGFMSERLLNVYLEKNKYTIKRYEMAFIK